MLSKPTIVDVAQRAGVSTSLVSRVINNRGSVGKTSRESILRAMDDLQYRPNAAARRLKRQRSQTLGLILPDVSLPVSNRVALAIQHHAYQRGYFTLIHLTDDTMDEDNYIAALYEENCEGFLFLGRPGSQRIVDTIARRGIPMVLIHRDVVPGPTQASWEIPAIDIVMWDLGPSVYRATRHVLDVGHRRVGLIMPNYRGYDWRALVDSYRQAHQDVNVPVDDELCGQLDPTAPASLHFTKRLIESADPPTAWLAIGTMSTVGALHAIEAAGLRVPDQVSFIGTEDPHLFGFPGPRYTTIRFPTDELASAAVDLLQHRMGAGPTRSRRRIVIDTELVAGESVAPPPVERRPLTTRSGAPEEAAGPLLA